MAIRNTGRRPLDFYETPPHYIAALLHCTQFFGTVYEPCVGDGAIASALKTRCNKVITNDIDPKRRADTHYDACVEIPRLPALDWIVTNPPFSQAFEILTMSFSFAPNLAFLTRLSFLEPTSDREQFLENYPPNQIVVLPRYSFRANDAGKKQTDSVTCCWLIWRQKNPEIRGVSIYGRGMTNGFAILQDLL